MPSARATGPARIAFRADVEGLRAVALIAIFLTHAGISVASGGYIGPDVFFVISGYLITLGLVRELTDGGTISLLGFYARRARRLLPLALLGIAVIALLSALILPPVRNQVVGYDIAAAAGYVINWRFAIESVDYFGTDAAASPIQHFWTLAVEEQFYVLWPALMLLATWWWRRRGGDLRRGLWVLAVGGTLASFVYALWLTRTTPTVAYFSTPARAWELGAGAVVALALEGGRRVPARVGVALGLAGLAAITVPIFVYDAATHPVPGVAALAPVLGVCAIIVGGTGRELRLLSNRAMRHVGRLSYAWYIWHWPAIVFAQELFGELSPLAGVLVILACYLPAYASHRLVELPVLHARPLKPIRRSIGLGVATTATGIACGLLVLSAASTDIPQLAAERALGAEALPTQTIQRSATSLRPTPGRASEDRGLIYRDRCLLRPRQTSVKRCVYGASRPRKTLVLTGDSHAMHWFPAFNELASRNRWRIVVYMKAGCGMSAVTLFNREMGRAYRECDRWRDAAVRRIARERADLVVTTQYQDTRVVSGGRQLDARASRDAIARGYPATLRRLRSGGARVLVLGDTPIAPGNVPECVSGAPRALAECAFALDDAKVTPPANRRDAVRRVPGAHLIDAQAKLCPGGTCPAVMGGVLVYRDAHHMSATFARTMATWLGRQLTVRRLP